MIETIIDHVAVLTGIAPETIRAINLKKAPPPLAPPASVPATLAASPPAPHAVPAGVPEIPAKMFSSLMASTDFAFLQRQVDGFNAKNLWRKRGIAAVPTEYSCGWGPSTHHGSKIDVYPDGTILVFVSGQELGQGLYTKCAQICALEMGLPDTSLIEVRMTSTAMIPEGGGTYGSMASGANAWGMQLACRILKVRPP